MVREIMTFAEQEVLLEAIKQYGKNFKLIQTVVFRKLSIKQIRNAYYKLIREDQLIFNGAQEIIGDQSESKQIGFQLTHSIYNFYEDDVF